MTWAARWQYCHHYDFSDKFRRNIPKPLDEVLKEKMRKKYNFSWKEKCPEEEKKAGDLVRT